MLLETTEVFFRPDCSAHFGTDLAHVMNKILSAQQHRFGSDPIWPLFPQIEKRAREHNLSGPARPAGISPGLKESH